MNQIFIGPNEKLEKYQEMTNEEINGHRVNLKNGVYLCEECRTKMTIAAFGEGYKVRCHFKAFNKHELGCKFKKEKVSKKPVNLNDKKEIESLERALLSLMKETIQSSQDIQKKKKNKTNYQVGGGSLSSSTTRSNVLQMPDSKEKFKLNSKYKFKKQVTLKKFISNSNNRIIYVNNIGVDGLSLEIRESTGYEQFETLWNKFNNSNHLDCEIIIAFLFEGFSGYLNKNDGEEKINLWKSNSVKCVVI